MKKHVEVMMWKAFTQQVNSECECEFARPVTVGQIAKAEQALSVKFPEDLVSLLTETNGIIGDYGSDLVWTLKKMVEDNVFFRNSDDFKKLYMPFECALFFGDDGNGDQFFYAVLNGQIRSGNIYKWDHENDSRIWVASSLKDYLERVLSESLEE